MTNTVVIGLNFGDEGKGKVVDLIAPDYDYVVRFQGGNNAGHTIINDGVTYKFHLIPSGILHGKICVLGNGMVIHPESLVKEMKVLEDKGFDLKNKIFISDKAHIITTELVIKDKNNDKSEGIGTTGKGIGTTYTQKMSRKGLRFAEALEEMNDNIVNTEPDPYILYLEEYVSDTSLLLHNAYKDNKKILFEGSQGTFLDIDHGTYPYVTSSNTVASNACTGSGLPLKAIDEVVGVVKAYATRVGNGAFPTELHDKTGEFLVKNGNEFGTTTGRQRRCGWLDLVMLKYALRINGVDSMVVTKLDVLSGLDEIKLCIGYENHDTVPTTIKQLDSVKPIYKVFKGWKQDITSCRNYDELPQEAREYLEYIENETGVKFALVSVGADRNANIIKTI